MYEQQLARALSYSYVRWRRGGFPVRALNARGLCDLLIFPVLVRLQIGADVEKELL